MRHEDDHPARGGEAAEDRPLHTTITQLVRHQDEQLDWMRRIEQALRATRESMLVYQSGAKS